MLRARKATYLNTITPQYSEDLKKKLNELANPESLKYIYEKIKEIEDQLIENQKKVNSAD